MKLKYFNYKYKNKKIGERERAKNIIKLRFSQLDITAHH